ncbi:MAG: S-layer homology domain-containing protein [Clostridiales bacterium]|nr:S-layer homology domain-containing protein [Clostridiales bacterium]
MKHSKKLLSLLLVLCMVLSLTCTAFAAEEESVTLASWSGGTSVTNNGTQDVLKDVALAMKDSGDALNSYGSMKVATSSYGNLTAQPWYGVAGFSAENYGYIEFSVATAGYENLKLTTVLSGNDRVPTTYKLEYSLDGTTWTAVDGVVKAALNQKTIDGAETTSLELPAAIADQERVTLRLVQTEAAKEKDGKQTNAGNLYIWSIALTGTEVSVTPPVEKSDDIVILYTNDVHTYIDQGLSYASIAAYKTELEETHNNVLLVDAGDHIQGTAYGSMDKGETIIKLMNAAGYDLATLGNHEFDYNMTGCMNAISWADFPYVSCNFYHESEGVRGENVLDSYKIFDAGDEKVALIGITTPESFTKSTPAYFQDADGNYIYGISGGVDGAALYADVQKAIDEAKADGATKIIALGHLGDDPASDPWNSEDVIANVTGLDAFIDGHSHSTVEMKEVADKDGNTVILTQTGSYFAAMGKMTISEDGIMTELVTEYDGVDADVKALQDAWIEEIDTQLGTVIGYADVTFDNYDEEGNRLVRKQETNTGDFAADALYYLFDNMDLDVDVAIMNGGGVRNKAITGEISYKTCKDIHTFGNVACLQTVTGQQILDALEWGAKDATLDGSKECGGFLQVSGLIYDINLKIPSTVQKDEKGVWTGGPTGEYRVSNVEVFNKETGEYEPLDLEAEYNLAGYNYTLRDLGDGFAMFEGAVNVLDYVMEDYMVLANYVKSFPVDEETGLPTISGMYESVYGEGRIFVWQNPFTDVNNKTDWFAGAVEAVYQGGVMNGMTETTFEPATAVSRAMVAAILYRLADSPAVSDDMSCPFTDVQKGDWYYDAIVWAYNEGILKGVSETLAAPNAAATREQVAVLFYRYEVNSEVEPTGAELEAILSVYPDADQIAPWAKIGVAFCTHFGLMQGDDDGFRPQNNMTRAELAQVIVNFVLAATSQPDEVPEAPEAITEAVLAA